MLKGGELKIVREIVGDGAYVSIPGAHKVVAHTHPSSIYGDIVYHPPSNTDFKQALISAIRGDLLWDVVISPHGSWAYAPSPALVAEMFKVEPNIKQVLGPPLKEGEGDRDLQVSDDLFGLLDVLENNSGNNGARLAGLAPAALGKLTVEQYIREMHNLLDEDLGFTVLYFPGDAAIKLPMRQQQNGLVGGRGYYGLRLQ